jgi:hypothetical protein
LKASGSLGKKITKRIVSSVDKVVDRWLQFIHIEKSMCLYVKNELPNKLLIIKKLALGQTWEKNMKILAVILSVFFMLSGSIFAASPFNKFKDTFTGVAQATAQQYLDSFAKDLGVVLGGGSFHSGQNLGLPGLDVGIHAPARSVNSDDIIVKNADVSVILFPIIQAELGLPAKIDLLVRYLSYDDSSLFGIGARYGIIKNKTPGLPSVSVQVIYNSLNVSAGVNKLKADTTSILGSASLNLPVIDPYFGIGYDTTNVTPDSSITLPASGMKGAASTLRVEGGINLALLPLTYLQLGGVLIDGSLGYTLGLGVKF